MIFILVYSGGWFCANLSQNSFKMAEDFFQFRILHLTISSKVVTFNVISAVIM